MEELMRRTKFITTVCLGILVFSRAAYGHEFWLDAHDYTLEAGEGLQVDIRVGQDFAGNKYSFNPDLFYDFSYTDSSGKHPIEGRIGDRPAVSMVPSQDGLLVLNHFSTSQLLTYDEYAEFESFVQNKGLDWVLGAHETRGLPEDGFGEGYTRFAKSLISVGSGVGQDTDTGMPLELIALKNPYVDDVSGGLPVRIIWQKVGIPDIQVDVFQRPANGGEVIKTHVLTDENGIANVPIIAGDIYMINAVHMIIPATDDIDRTGAVWHSLWASLTFTTAHSGE